MLYPVLYPMLGAIWGSMADEDGGPGPYEGYWGW